MGYLGRKDLGELRAKARYVRVSPPARRKPPRTTSSRSPARPRVGGLPSNVLREEPRGSTGRGITPAYSDETGQWQITYADFLGGPTTSPASSPSAPTAPAAPSSTSAASARKPGISSTRLTQAEQRANAEGIAKWASSRRTSSTSPLPRAHPFTLNLDRLTEVYWKAGTGSRRTSARSASSSSASSRRPHHHRRVRPGLLARQAPRLFAQRHRLAHLHAGVLRERRHPRAAIHTFRRGQGLRHQGRHPHVPHPDGRRRPAHHQAQGAGIRHQHRPPAHGRLV
jgi:hypothetical protein